VGIFIFIIFGAPSPDLVRRLVGDFLYHTYKVTEFGLKVKDYFKFFFESLGCTKSRLECLIWDFHYHLSLSYIYNVSEFLLKVKLYFKFFS